MSNIVLKNNNFSLIQNENNQLIEGSIFDPGINGHFIEHFLEIKGNKSIHTAKAYERDIKQFFGVSDVTLINIDLIRMVTAAHVERFILHLSKQGKSSATIHRKISSLSSLYNWLLNYSSNVTNKAIISFNPFARIKEAKPTLNSKETEFLTENEMKRLLAAIKIDSEKGLRDYIIISLALTTALRKSEMINIKIGDISSVADINVIKVRRKGSKDSAVKLQPKLKELIDRYIEMSGRSYDDTEDYLFKGYGKIKSDKLSSDSLNRIIKALTEKAYINKNITVHSLRHSAITLSLNKGATLENVRDFAGHKNVATTNRYLHSINNFKNYAGDLIDIL